MGSALITPLKPIREVIMRRRSYEGIGNPFYGKHHTDEVKQKMREHWANGRPKKIEPKRTRYIGVINPSWTSDIFSDRQEYWRAYNNQRNYGKRQELIRFLGGKCIKCGFSDYRALQIDHLNGGGHKEIRDLGHYQMYKRVYAHPEDYQLLCANCNSIKRYENNEWANIDITKEDIK